MTLLRQPLSPGQQSFNPVYGVIRNPGEHLAQVRFRIYAVQLTIQETGVEEETYRFGSFKHPLLFRAENIPLTAMPLAA